MGRSKRGRLRGGLNNSAAAVIAVSMIVAGCSSAQNPAMQRAGQQAFEAAVEREIHDHVYQMGCRALVPLAEEVFWAEGYDDVHSRPGSTGLMTGWNSDGVNRYRLEMYAQSAGANRCSVRVMEELDRSVAQRRRDVEFELRLLEKIDEAEAERIRSKAEREAQRAVDR